jgi:Ser/Thr protein kinase RdoA (MazF antagonist)
VSASDPLFECHPRFAPGEAELPHLRDRLERRLRAVTGDEALSLQPLGRGQNLNFRARGERPLLLKVRRQRGYPALDVIRESSKLLEAAGVRHPALVASGAEGDVTPYGWLALEWIEGEPGSRDAPGWLERLLEVLEPVHAIRPGFFGALDGGPRHATWSEQIADFRSWVAHGFAGALKRPAELAELERAGWVTAGFAAELECWLETEAARVESGPGAVLLHGDPFPENVIRTAHGSVLLDWDEARAGGWPWEASRLAHWLEDPDLVVRFAELRSDTALDADTLDRVLRCERVRTLGRELFKLGLVAAPAAERERRARALERRIRQLWS